MSFTLGMWAADALLAGAVLYQWWREINKFPPGAA